MNYLSVRIDKLESFLFVLIPPFNSNLDEVKTLKLNIWECLTYIRRTSSGAQFYISAHELFIFHIKLTSLPEDTK